MKTIDEILSLVKKCKKLCENHKDDSSYKQGLFLKEFEFNQLEEWLTELKEYKVKEFQCHLAQQEGINIGYEKAINDFTEKLKSDEFQKYTLDMVFETSRNLSYSECIDAFHEYIDETVNKMKNVSDETCESA